MGGGVISAKKLTIFKNCKHFFFNQFLFCWLKHKTKQQKERIEGNVNWWWWWWPSFFYFCWKKLLIRSGYLFFDFFEKKSTTLTKKEEKKSKIGYSTNKIHHFSLLPLFEFINLKKRNKSGTLYIAAHMNAAHFLLLLLFWWKIRSRFLDNNNFFWNSNDLKVEKDNNKMNWPLVHWLVENRKKTFQKLEKKISLEINFPGNFSDFVFFTISLSRKLSSLKAMLNPKSYSLNWLIDRFDSNK